MKTPRRQIDGKTHVLPCLQFQAQQLTSFAGVVIFQKLFAELGLSARLRACCRHLPCTHLYSFTRLLQVLILHILLGFRHLRDVNYYRHDPLVKHSLGLGTLPSPATLSRMLSQADLPAVEHLRGLLRTLCLERLRTAKLARVTLDFDGSVQPTKKHAEGSAVGYCRKKKGLRSYYPLFCTLAQIGQVFDVWHRPGNVHDSHGAIDFVAQCIAAVREALPRAILEVRMDSAFFSELMVKLLDGLRVEYSLSVPFERLAELKGFITQRGLWWRLSAQQAYFQKFWKPKSWEDKRRFVFVRSQTTTQRKGPLQLDLFEPREFALEFKVILTNKTTGARKLIRFHEGRGSQEGIFAELKSQGHMEYIPVHSLAGNQIYLLCTLLAHNLARELQIRTAATCRPTTLTRRALWVFKGLRALQNTVIRCAGRLTRPQGQLTLTMNANPTLEADFAQFLLA
jgi:hypothetical protein